MCKSLASILLLASFLLVAESKILDLNGESIESIARALCRDQTDEVVLLSTIERLNEFMTYHRIRKTEFTACANKHIRIVSELFYITLSDKLCRWEDVSRVQKFHSKYMENNSAPHMLAAFFLRYVGTVAEICQNNLAANLRLATEENKLSPQLTGDLLQHWPVDEAVPLILWDPLAPVSSRDLNSRETSQLMEKIERSSSDQFSLFVGVKEVAKYQRLQLQCQHKLKPIYDQTTRPLAALADLGFLKLHFTADASGLVNQWRRLTQICEFVLHIGFVGVSAGGQQQADAEVVSRADAMRSADYQQQQQKLRSREEEIEFKPKYESAEIISVVSSARSRPVGALKSSMANRVAERNLQSSKSLVAEYATCQRKAAEMQLEVSTGGAATRKLIAPASRHTRQLLRDTRNFVLHYVMLINSLAAPSHIVV